MWEVLKECCEVDSETALVLLQAANMSCVEGNLRKVVFNGKNEILFKIPNFCISDPIYERDYSEVKNNEENIEKKDIIIIIYYYDEKKKIKEQKIENITNKSTVIDVKKKFAEIKEIDMEKNKIRLFYKGLELLDDNLLCYNNVENMAKILCVVNNIEEENS